MKKLLYSAIIFLSYVSASHAQVGPGVSCTEISPCYVINSGGGVASTVNQGTQAASASGSTWFVDPYIAGSEVSVTNPLAVQPGTGSTFPISASSLPLPTGAATSANQTNGSQLTGVLGQNGSGISSTANPVPVNIIGTQGAATTPTQTSVSCTTSSSTILAANSATQSESFHLAATAANAVWLNFAGATAVQAAPSFDLQPGQTITWSVSGGLLPVSAITCIASASTSVTEMYK